MRLLEEDVEGVEGNAVLFRALLDKNEALLGVVLEFIGADHESLVAAVENVAGLDVADHFRPDHVDGADVEEEGLVEEADPPVAWAKLGVLAAHREEVRARITELLARGGKGLECGQRRIGGSPEGRGGGEGEDEKEKAGHLHTLPVTTHRRGLQTQSAELNRRIQRVPQWTLFKTPGKD